MLSKLTSVFLYCLHYLTSIFKLKKHLSLYNSFNIAIYWFIYQIQSPHLPQSITYITQSHHLQSNLIYYKIWEVKIILGIVYSDSSLSKCGNWGEERWTGLLEATWLFKQVLLKYTITRMHLYDFFSLNSKCILNTHYLNTYTLLKYYLSCIILNVTSY